MADQQCEHKNKLQRRTQRYSGSQWHDSTIEIGCADCDCRLGIKTTAWAFATEAVPRQVLPIEPYTGECHG